MLSTSLGDLSLPSGLGPRSWIRNAVDRQPKRKEHHPYGAYRVLSIHCFLAVGSAAARPPERGAVDQRGRFRPQSEAFL